MTQKGKKPYLLSVGKPNPAKLGNFLEIDAFCIVSCPENALLDSREYLKPVLTPYELIQALDPHSQWNIYNYELDICQLESELSNMKISNTNNPNGDDDIPYFSLATGKLVSKTSEKISGIETSESEAVSNRADYSVSNFIDDSAAAQYLGERTYQGLEPQIGETPVAIAVEGREGIARGYKNECG